MFKTTRIVNLQTPQTAGGCELDFRIIHRFGSMGAASNGGVHTLYGFDNAEDIRFSFDYGITDNFQVGIGRSKKMEALDGSVKWKFSEQTFDNKFPFSMVAYSMTTLTPVPEKQLYSGMDNLWVKNNKIFLHRFTYHSQIIIARKFANWLSIVIAPSYTYRNLVKAEVNPSNGAEDENGIFSVGAGMRIRVSRSVSVLTDYFYIHSDFRKGNTATEHVAPIGVGAEIETGGHVFHITLTNASGITGNYFIPHTTDSWAKGGYKFGFSISRRFTIISKK